MLLVLACVCAVALAAGQKWLAIAKDDLHDPQSPGVGVLQEPAEALGALGAQVPDAVGNQVRWVQALDRGLIQPRTNILPETKVNLRTTEVLLVNTAHMGLVKFPHRQHTAWLDCSNCHGAVGLFEQKAGATKIGMFRVLAGEKCGLCHGAVAFPLTECDRCHSVKRDGPEHAAFNGALVREAGSP
ncbi:c(7)-type cytochrome triheme domain-containing protein [Ramlibacter sp. AN1133]|uniref:c(7)-type cytochrome triheme domain-containing protein n=1 Tax=Ramlibacter sp. AN1133 TaxID=3133429 RepID=UPI0030C2E858